MSPKQHKPQWWQVYVMLPILAALFVLEIRLGLKGTLNILAQLGILFLIYAFMQAWIRANRRALMDLDVEQGQWEFHVYEVAPADLVRAREAAKGIESRPLSQTPTTELRGVLSTTFEMDELDRDSAFPIGDKALQQEHVLNVKEARDIEA